MSRRPGKAATSSRISRAISVVVIGSYREDLPGLLALAQHLAGLGVSVLHPPPQARPVGEESGFVRLDCDRSPDQGRIQQHVFSLIDRADAVILYAPAGRIGISAAMEIGYALRAKKRIFSTAPPKDLTIRTLIGYKPAALSRFLQTATVLDDTSGHAGYPLS